MRKLDAVRRKIKDMIAGDVLDLPSHSIAENRQMWNTYDWSKGGSEWTNDTPNPDRFKADLIKMMHHHIKSDSVILEIGPGAGRWTKYLEKLASKLIAVDIAPKAVEECKKNLVGSTHNIFFHVITNIDLSFIPDNSVDYVWSYDVFVHVNPTDAEKYVIELGRIMKNNAIGIIHHPDKYADPSVAAKGFRSKLNAQMMKQYLTSQGFLLIEQNENLPHKKGDIISIFRKRK